MSILDGVRHRCRTLFQRERLAREMEEELRFHAQLDAANELPAQSRLGNLTLLGEQRRVASGLAVFRRTVPGRALRRSATATRTDHRRRRPVCHGARDRRELGRFQCRRLADIAKTIRRRPGQVGAFRRRRPGRVHRGRLRPFARWNATHIGRDSDVEDVSARSPIDEDGQMSYAFAQLVGDNYFDVMGLHLARGRGFHAADGGAAVISDSYWRSHFGASDSAIGRHLLYGKTEFVVTGIAASNFRGAS